MHALDRKAITVTAMLALAGAGCTAYYANRARNNYLQQQQEEQQQQARQQQQQAAAKAAQQKQADADFAAKLKAAHDQAVAQATSDAVFSYMSLVATGMKNGAASRGVFDPKAAIAELMSDGGLIDQAAHKNPAEAGKLLCLKGRLFHMAGDDAHAAVALDTCLRRDPTLVTSDDGELAFDLLDHAGHLKRIRQICKKSFRALRTDDDRYELLDLCVQHAHAPTPESALKWAPHKVIAWYKQTHAELEAKAAADERARQAQEQREAAQQQREAAQQQAQEQAQQQQDEQQEQAQQAAEEGQEARNDDIENLEKGGDYCSSITDNDDMENFCKGGDYCSSITDNDDLENLCKGGDYCSSITDNDDMENFCKGGDYCSSITDNDAMEDACKNGGRRAWFSVSR